MRGTNGADKEQGESGCRELEGHERELEALQSGVGEGGLFVVRESPAQRKLAGAGPGVL